MSFRHQQLTPAAMAILAALAIGAMRAEAGINQWTLVDEVPGSAYDVAVDPVRPSTVYAIAAGKPAAFYTSVDAGASWKVIAPRFRDLLRCVVVDKLVIDPRFPRTLYLIWEGDRGIGCHDNTLPSVARSMDGGNTWDFTFGPVVAAFPFGINGVNVIDIVIDPSNSSRLYVLTGYNPGLASNEAVLRSEDGGETWQQAGRGLPPGDTSTIFGFHATSLAVDPSAPNHLLLGGDDGNVYTSRNGAQSWHPRAPGPVASAGGSTTFGYPAALFFDPERPAIVYAYSNSTLEFFQSLDGAKTWSPVATGLPGTVSGVAVDPRGHETIYAASSNGLFEVTLSRTR